MAETLRTLIVEDSEDDCLILVDELRQQGFAPAWERVQTGPAMKEALERQDWDAVLADFNMPKFDGLRALQVLQESMLDIPFIVVSGTIGEDVAVETMKAGAHDYLLKDKLTRLGEAIRRELRDAETRRARRLGIERIRHLNRVLKAIRNIKELITRERDPQALLQKACEILVESRGYYTSCMMLCDGDRILLSAIAGPLIGLPSLRKMVVGNQLPECVKHALIRPGALVIQDPVNTCESCPVSRDYGKKLDVAALRLECDSETFGALLVSLPSGMADDPEELDLLREAAGDVAFALRSIDINADRTKTKRDLAESQETTRTILQHLRDGVLVASAETEELLFANEAMCAMLGYTRTELLSLDLRGVHPQESIPHVVEEFGRQARGEIALATDIPVKRKDGSVFLADVNSTLVEIEGRPCIVGVFRDRTQQRQLEEQLKLAQRLEAVGRLAGGVAHDFNNLLSVILSYAGFAADALRESDPTHADIVEIQNAGQRAAALTRQLLAFSSKQILEPEVLSINKVVSGIESMLRRLLGEDIDIEVHLDEPLGSVMADPGQIEQIIMNLAVNARDAMPQGGKLTIETANAELDEGYAEQHVAVKPGRFVMLSVTDTGTGMEAETRAHVFEPFFTTKEKGKGTGLGLSTVYGIVKQSGGNIWIYTEPGSGTTFKVYLPLVDAPAVDVRRRLTTAMATGSETVLVVEDEDAVRKLSERILRNAGYKVLAAASGGDALVLCEKQHETIDLLLTDVVMPQMSGRELAERLTKLFPRLKVLYMSGYTDNAIVHHGVLALGTRFIGKPFAAAELTRKVREVLGEEKTTGA